MALDRLTALFRHVQFTAVMAHDQRLPQLWAVQETNGIRVSFAKTTELPTTVQARVGLNFGSHQSPLLQALPNELTMLFTPEHSAFPIAALVLQETQVTRCGTPVVLDRLYEVLLIMLLRGAIEKGQTLPGLLAGLADDYIKHALVAVHENPGAAWSTEKLAECCGLSRTAFYQRFNRCIGVPPMQYVRSWRMSLANIQLQQGERISRVAVNMGYRSVEGFSRAFYQYFEQWPGGVTKVLG